MTRWTVRTNMVLHRNGRLLFEAGWASLGATTVAWRIDRDGRHIAELDAPESFGTRCPNAERVGPTPTPAELEN